MLFRSPLYIIKSETITPIIPSIGRLVNRPANNETTTTLVISTSPKASKATALSPLEFIFFASVLLKNQSHNLKNIEIISIINETISNFTGVGFITSLKDV